MKKPKDKVIAYHCSNCGGVAMPGSTLCPYCSQKLAEWFESQNKSVRLLVDDVYLNSVHTIPTITVDCKQYIAGLSDLDTFVKIRFYLTKHLQRQIRTMENIDRKWKHGKVRKVKLELLEGFEMYFGMDAKIEWGLPNVSINAPTTIDMQLLLVGLEGWQNIVIPENLTCPNCGAEVTSRYGCCEYCGGWVEWIREAEL